MLLLLLLLGTDGVADWVVCELIVIVQSNLRELTSGIQDEECTRAHSFEGATAGCERRTLWLIIQHLHDGSGGDSPCFK